MGQVSATDGDFDADFLSDHGENDPVTPVPTRPTTHIVAAASKQVVFSNDSFFPGPVAYQVEQSEHQLFWDVMYIFDQFKVRVPIKSSKMMFMFKEVASSKGYLGFKSIHFRRLQSSTMLQVNVVSTSLVIAWYMSLIEGSRLDTKIDYGKECLKSLSSVIMQFCRSSGGFGFMLMALMYLWMHLVLSPTLLVFQAAIKQHCKIGPEHGII